MLSNEINLLPPQARQERLTRVYLNRGGRLLRLVGGMVLLILVVQVAGGAGYLYAQRQLRADDAAGTKVASETRRLIASTNGTLQLANTWFTHHEPWTPLFRGMLAAVPGNIDLTSIRLNEDTGELGINGKVSSRTDVVNFQRQLEELEWVADVDAPLSNFETGAEAAFSFSIRRQ